MKAFMQQFGPGIILSFLGPFIVFMIGGSSPLEARIIWAVVWGGGVALLCVVPVNLLQVIGADFLKRFPQRKRILILNAPVLLMIGLAIFSQWKDTRPEKRFVKMLTATVPGSVEAIQQGGFLALDSEFWVLKFYISKEDFSKMVTNEGFERRDPQAVTDQERLKWKLRLEEDAKIQVQLTPQWEMFVRQEKRGEKHLFFDPEQNECVFVLDAY